MRPKQRARVSVIIPGELLISSFPTPEDASWLRGEFGVDAVISLQDHFDLRAKNLDEKELEEAYARAGIVFQRIPISDFDPEDVKRHVGRVIDTIHGYRTAGCAVLVHCNAGYNRAPTAVIGYLHRHGGMELRAAEAFVRERRGCAPYMAVLESK